MSTYSQDLDILNRRLVVGAQKPRLFCARGAHLGTLSLSPGFLRELYVAMGNDAN